MPFFPRTWSTGDFFTASRLDNDLYQFNGQWFSANGTRFHARRPIYKGYSGYTAPTNAIPTGTWAMTYATTSNANPESSVIADTPGMLNAWFDPNLSGNINLGQLQYGGGTASLSGGIGLVTAYTLWPNSSNTGNVANGIGNSTAPTTAPNTLGTSQGLNSAHQTCNICVDLMDMNPGGRLANFAFNGAGGTLDPQGAPNADGSGWASRFLAHWASVYTSTGTAVTNLPAPTTWTGTTAITSTLLNGAAGLRGPLRFLNMPPLCRAAQGSTQNLLAGTAATINLTATSGFDSYSGFNNGTDTYTVPLAGLYFVYGQVGIGNINGTIRAGIQINGGTTYWGPKCVAPGSGTACGAKAQIFSLNAGDTITLQGASSVASTTSSSNPPRLVILCVSLAGAPSPLATPPDTSFRFTAGTPGPVTSLLNAHISNDLNFLLYRPYLMAYQTVSQNYTPGTVANLSLDTVAGIVHGDNGDNYSGWNATNKNYVAPVAGWYMVVEEVFYKTPTLTATPSAVALVGLNPHGTDVNDRYQQANLPGSSADGGASLVSYYYLRAGDTLTPAAETYDSSSTTLGTSTAVNSHMEIVWLGE